MTGAMNLIHAILWLPLIYAQSGAVHTVDVGEHGFTFDPDTLSVSPGDKVEFHFYPGDHSVAQAAFSKPCHPLNQSSFFSGFIPATNGESSEVFTLTVNDTSPIWYYCGQVGHCQAGMVGVINPPRNGPNTLDAFKSAARNAGDSTVPSAVGGGTLGKPSTASTMSSGTSQTSTSTSSSTSTSATTSSTSTSTATSTSSPSPSPTSEGSRFRLWPSLSIVMLLSVLVAMLMS
ncbi:cupredoxin [Aspergillus lentulus]|uniref:cupredoxin domain-containing protein n=1 Tax=Aspergillus lentulus TaxID=293939 RepID=UPI001392FDD5|nr:cupredoxin [Aspergillus lentulus]GFF46716.1 cupredoxin [Aspergillus lentulus]